MPRVTERVQEPTRVLIVFNTLCFYGMERATMDIFDILRPDVAPLYLTTRSNERYDTAVLRELKKRNFSLAFFHDTWDWPRLGKPHSLVELMRMLWCLVIANCDVFRLCLRSDVIYLPTVSSAYLSFAACLYYRLTNRKVIYHIHDLTAPKRRLRIMSLWVSDFVHCTRSSLDILQRANAFLHKKANHCIPYMVEFHAADSEFNPAGWRKDTRHIVYAGQVSRHKGIAVLIEAFRLLAKDYPDISLDLLGGASCGDFEKTVQRSPALSERVRFWGFRDDVFQFLHRAYVYVQPSLFPFKEAGCRAVLEAMAAGVPSVCFPSGVLPEYVVNGKTGLVCAQETSACLADAIHRFLGDAEFRDGCGAAARERYEDRYSGVQVRKHWLDLLRN